jgi:hypothetical protein
MHRAIQLQWKYRYYLIVIVIVNFNSLLVPAVMGVGELGD